jgi:hypothetical protein
MDVVALEAMIGFRPLMVVIAYRARIYNSYDRRNENALFRIPQIRIPQRIELSFVGEIANRGSSANLYRTPIHTASLSISLKDRLPHSFKTAAKRAIADNQDANTPMFEQAFKNIDDVLWKEAGCTTELDYTEQTSWLLFLKYLDGFEQDRAYLFLIDPARRQLIKLWGRAHVVENDTALVERLFDKGYKAKPERAILFTIEAWDVNCSAHIVTRLPKPKSVGRSTPCKQRLPNLKPRTRGCARSSPSSQGRRRRCTRRSHRHRDGSTTLFSTLFRSARAAGVALRYAHAFPDAPWPAVAGRSRTGPWPNC